MNHIAIHRIFPSDNRDELIFTEQTCGEKRNCVLAKREFARDDSQNMVERSSFAGKIVAKNSHDNNECLMIEQEMERSRRENMG